MSKDKTFKGTEIKSSSSKENKMKHTQEEIDAAKKMVKNDMGCECNQPMIDMTGESNGTTTFECWSCGHIVVYFKEEHNAKRINN